MSVNVTLYNKPGCHLCEDVERKIRAVRSRVEFHLAVIDITTDPALQMEHGFDIPVVTVNGTPFSKLFLNDEAFENYVKEVNALDANQI